MMTIDKKELALLLLNAQETATPLGEKYRQEFTLEEAYAVQQEIKKEKERRGCRIVGQKIGFTSKGMRERFNIPFPDYGYLFVDQLYPQGTPIQLSNFIAPKVEGEIAFLIEKDLKGPYITVADVADATKGVMACLEFVDSRWGGFQMSFIDSIADNGGCGGYLLGSKLVPIDNLDLRYIAMFMQKNGELLNSGAGVEVLGDPLNAVAWLANELAKHGTYFRAGDIVLSGAITAAVPVEKGDQMNICFSELGNIEVRFV